MTWLDEQAERELRIKRGQELLDEGIRRKGSGNGAAPGMDSGGSRLLPSPSNPLAVARKLIEEKYRTDAGLTLINHRGDFFRWDGACWPERDRLDIRRDAYAFVEGAIYLDAEGKSQPFAPTVRKINDLIDALRACVGITSEHEPPVWLDERANPPASEIIAMQNGLLHLPARRLLPHTPGFFVHHALAFPFVADAPLPVRWLAFLRQLWPNDHASIATLQELFGYVIGGGTRQQKIFLLVGPLRAGKGTIGRVLTGILGRHNVAAPTLASLSTNFGLAPLIGKPLALMSDARLSAKADAKVVVERLLSISGEDSLTIDRKYREPWTGRLPSRFVILTNELPGFTDASGALSSRFIVLVFSKSFLGREDPGLTDELLTEAPSILKWGLAGLDRLNERGYLVMPESGRDAVQQLEDLASPVAAFVRERCRVGQDASVEVDVLWGAWKEWCEGQGRGHGTKAVFGRDLRAALPAVQKSRPSTEEGRQYRYEGISVGTTLDKCPDCPDHPDQNPPAGPGGPSSPSSSPMYHLHGARTCPRCAGEGCRWCGGTGRLVDDEPGETRP